MFRSCAWRTSGRTRAPGGRLACRGRRAGGGSRHLEQGAHVVRPDGREGAAADLACRAQHPWAPRQLSGLAPAGGWEEGHGGGPAESPQARQGQDVHCMP